jgi:hypothetical protein
LVNENDKLTALIQIGMAVLGALARVLNRKDESKKLAHVVSDMFVSGFTGLLLFWMTRSMEIDQSWLFALSGIAGWIGPKVIDKAVEIVSKKTGIELTGEDGGKK